MKTASFSRFAGGALALGLLVGCTNLPVRRSTLEFNPDQLALADEPGVVPPSPLHTVAPFYPTEYKRLGIEGAATIACLVDPTGRVVDATVKNATNSTFALHALDAVEQWTFRPATRDGSAVAMRVNVPFLFIVKN